MCLKGKVEEEKFSFNLLFAAPFVGDMWKAFLVALDAFSSSLQKKKSSVVFIIVRAGVENEPTIYVAKHWPSEESEKCAGRMLWISKNRQEFHEKYFLVALSSATASKQSRERVNVPCERTRKISSVVLLLSLCVFFPSPIYESTTRASEFSHFHTAERSVSCLAENLMFESASSMRIFERLWRKSPAAVIARVEISLLSFDLLSDDEVKLFRYLI